MPQSKLSLEEVTAQMGIELQKSGDLSEEYRSRPITVNDLQADSQPPEKSPKLQILLIGLGVFLTLGIGTIALLWGMGDALQQQAKKADTLTTEQPAKQTPEQQKEVAELKTKLVMQQQKEDAAKLAAERAKAATPSPSPTPASVPTVTPVQTTPVATNTATKPISQMQPSTQDRALLAALQKEKQETTAQLASLRQLRQQETAQLGSLRKSRQQETSQLGSLRKSRQQETSQLAALRQLRQQQNSQLLTAKAETLSEQRKRDSLRSQRNGNLARTFTPQPNRVAQRTAIATAKPAPAKVAALPKLTQPTSVPAVAPQQPRLDYEQVVALASYGGTPEDLTPKTVPANQPVALTGSSAMSPILRLPVGEVVAGKLVTPFYTLIGNGDGITQNTKASATVTIDKAIEVGSGWHLPAGSAIEFELQIADNGMIQAVSKKVTYGNTEIDIPVGAFSITGKDNQPLFAQIREVNGSQLASADFRSALFGGAAEVGNVLVNSGNSSTVSIGAGTTIATQNNGGGNIIGAIFKGAFSPLAQTQVSRAQALANKADKMSKVGYLLPGTTMRVYVAKAATFQIPVESNSAQPLTTSQAPISTVAPKVARLDPSVTGMSVVTPPDPTVDRSVTNPSGSNAIAPSSYYTPPVERIQVVPQPNPNSSAITNPYTTPTPTTRTSEAPQPPVSNPQPANNSYTPTPTPPSDTSSYYTPTPTQAPGNSTQPPIGGEASIQPVNLPTSQGNFIIQPSPTVPSSNPQLTR
jgi:hypothetical protein